jgi:hypothetical protein
VGKTYLETEYGITTVRRNQSGAVTSVGTVENKTDVVRRTGRWWENCVKREINKFFQMEGRERAQTRKAQSEFYYSAYMIYYKKRATSLGYMLNSNIIRPKSFNYIATNFNTYKQNYGRTQQSQTKSCPCTTSSPDRNAGNRTTSHKLRKKWRPTHHATYQ